MKNKKEISEERIRLLETAVGDISDRFVREAHEAHEAHSPEKKTRTKILTAPAWLRPVAACLAVLILGGLVVFSIPVVNNIISHRGPAELPGTDVAEADTTAEQEETDAPEETEVSIGDKIILPYGGETSSNPGLSINQLLDRNVNFRLIREEDISKIKPGMTFAEVKEMGIYIGITTDMDEAKLAINNGKMLLIKRKYTNQELHDMIAAEYKVDWSEGPDGKLRQILVDEAGRSYRQACEENPIETITVYEDQEEWEDFVKFDIYDLCGCLKYQVFEGVSPTKEELLKEILEGKIVSRINEKGKEVYEWYNPNREQNNAG